MIAAAIVACEIGFWVLLVAGLSLRYPLRRPQLGGFVLASVPLVDVALLIVAAVDLHRGAAFASVHGLAAMYLGFSIAFGPRLVWWADVRFAHRFADGPPPPPKPAAGSPERRAAMWSEWLRVVAAAVIAAVVLGVLSLFADADQRDAVLGAISPLALIVGVWLVAGPLWEETERRRR